jgi:hypothetical protein
VSVEYLELADYLAIAAEITGLNEETITKVAKLAWLSGHLSRPDHS